jgi:uncharacterized protein YneF (UPF0154 family)
MGIGGKIIQLMKENYLLLVTIALVLGILIGMLVFQRPCEIIMVESPAKELLIP